MAKTSRTMRFSNRTWSQLERLAKRRFQVGSRTRVIEILAERETVIMEVSVTKLQELAREGKLIVATKFGNVNLSSTADVWGEGPNVEGFQMTSEEAQMSNREIDELFGWQPGDPDFSRISVAAESWAEGQ